MVKRLTYATGIRINKTISKQDDKAIKTLFLTLIFILLVSGIIGLLSKNRDMVFDRFLSCALALVVLYSYKRLHMDNITLFFVMFAIVSHNLGLYGNTFHGFPFDRFQHFLGGFATSLVFLGYFSSSENKKINLKVVSLAITMTAGLGSFLEILEYVGYSTFGTGSGILFYGTGDFGAWNNAVWDMSYNTFGAIFASFLSFFLKKRPK